MFAYRSRKKDLSKLVNIVNRQKDEEFHEKSNDAKVIKIFVTICSR